MGSKEGIGKSHPGLRGQGQQGGAGGAAAAILPCRNGFSLAFTPQVLPGHSPGGGILPSTSRGLARHVTPGWETWEVAEAFRKPSAVCQLLSTEAAF